MTRIKEGDCCTSFSYPPCLVSNYISFTAPNTICSWIISKGGPTTISVYDIMMLVSAYLGNINLGFLVTIAHVMGAVAYYLGNISSGNSLTGCTFTP